MEPGPEPRRAKQEARNQKRAQGRGEVGAGAGPGAQAGPSAKRAVHLLRAPEGEGPRDGPGPQGDAPPFLAEPATQVRGVACAGIGVDCSGGPPTRPRADVRALAMSRLRPRDSSRYHH